jgi:hypothetical protein
VSVGLHSPFVGCVVIVSLQWSFPSFVPKTKKKKKHGGGGGGGCDLKDFNMIKRKQTNNHP